MRRYRQAAFTLIEVLIVVVLLGIIAAVVIPKVSGAVVDTKRSVLKTLLKQANTQFQAFYARHGLAPGIDPASGDFSESTLVSQMTKYVDLEGYTSDARDNRFLFGPYFDQFPVNPVNGRSDVLCVADGQDVPNAEGGTGWIYKPSTMEFYPNTPDYGPGRQW